MNSFSQNTTPEAQSNSPKKSGGFMARARGHFGGALLAVAGLFAIENSACAQETKPRYVRTGEILGKGVIHDTNCCGSATSAPLQAPPVVIALPTTTPTNSPAPTSSTNPAPVNTTQVVYIDRLPSDKACASVLVKPLCQPTLSIERGAASLISTTYIPTPAGTIVDINGPITGRFTGSASGANDVQQLRQLAGEKENIVKTVLSEQNIWRAIRAPLPGVAVNQTFIRETVYKPCYGQETRTRTTIEPACEKGPWCGGTCKGKH